MDNRYDLVVVGGGTAGVSCAWNAAKNGLKTLIIEQNSFLGGAITSSLVIPAMKTSEDSINNDFYKNLYEKLEKINGVITYYDGNKGWFNPELTKIALDMLMSEANVDILFETIVKNINTNNNKILSLSIESIGADNISFLKDRLLSLPIETRHLVDATGDAKICNKLNCEILNDTTKKQPRSLRFVMSGVDINKFANWLTDYDKDRNVTTVCKVGEQTHLSTAYTWDSSKWALSPLFEDAVENNILEYNDTNYFQIFSVAGTLDSIAFNAPRIIETTDAPNNLYSDARLSILRLANFCKKYFPGFENAHISSIANTIGTRVSRRILGEYVYTLHDLKNNKTFSNPVLISNYPIDIHSDTKNSSELVKLENNYELPLESLKVKNWSNLFVIGRCISAEFEAQAALRIIPSCFSMGEGLAKYLSKL